MGAIAGQMETAIGRFVEYYSHERRWLHRQNKVA